MFLIQKCKKNKIFKGLILYASIKCAQLISMEYIKRFYGTFGKW